MALLILALLQRIFLMSSLMLLLVWLIFFMVLIKLLPILGTISGKTVKLMVLALICLGNNCFFSSRRRHTRFDCDWSSDVCSSDLAFWLRAQKSPATVWQSRLRTRRRWFQNSGRAGIAGGAVASVRPSSRSLPVECPLKPDRKSVV